GTLLVVLLMLTCPADQSAGEKKALSELLGHPILKPGQTLSETQKYLEGRIPVLPKVTTAAEWQKHADRIRAEVLAKAVYRGEAAAWRDAKLKVEWLETMEGGPEYQLKKVRYEALPGLWIPALLYEPLKLAGKVPAALCVMGHEP